MTEPWEDETIGNVRDWDNDRNRNPITMMKKCKPTVKILASVIWIIGFLLFFLFPPIGVLIIVGAVTMTEKSS